MKGYFDPGLTGTECGEETILYGEIDIYGNVGHWHAVEAQYVYGAEGEICPMYRMISDNVYYKNVDGEIQWFNSDNRRIAHYEVQFVTGDMDNLINIINRKVGFVLDVFCKEKQRLSYKQWRYIREK